jgi:uncharacterized protein (DUF1501 family)
MVPLQKCVDVRVNSRGLVSRRAFLRHVAAGGAALAGLRWSDCLSARADAIRAQGKACILLWMAGGPSQFETFDPKPGADTQGPTKAIATSVPNLQIAEHWTRLAPLMKEVGLVRSMTSKEGNHGRATYLLHTSYAPSGGIVHPGFGSTVAQQLGSEDSDLPQFVSISGASIGPSYLGVRYAPFVVTNPTQLPDNLQSPVSGERLGRRLGLLQELEAEQLHGGTASLVRDHQTLYRQTSQMVLSPRTQAFRLDAEPDRVRDSYGRSAFGQGCLIARRLIEAGVTFVEVQANGWDTHGDELASLKKLIPPVDQATAALLTDLKSRDLLERTLVIWMGEFGRTPRINLTAGRDHYPQAFNVLLAGPGIRGGQVVGQTDARGVEIADRPVSVPDLFCTFCRALGLDPRTESQSNVGRPIKIVEHGAAVRELF